MSQLPTTVRRSVQLLGVLVLLAAATTVLTVALRDDLLAAWSAGHPADTDIKPPAFVPVAVVLFLVFAGLVGVLVPFLLAGANWARHSLAATVLLVALATLAGLRTDPPVAFVVAAGLSIVVDVALLVLLWHRATGAYVRDADEPAPTGV